MMEHEDVIKLPVNLKELQNKIKQAQTKLTQVQVVHASCCMQACRVVHGHNACCNQTAVLLHCAQTRVAVFARVRSVSTCCICIYTRPTYPSNTAACMGELYYKKLATVFAQGLGQGTMKRITLLHLVELCSVTVTCLMATAGGIILITGHLLSSLCSHSTALLTSLLRMVSTAIAVCQASTTASVWFQSVTHT